MSSFEQAIVPRIKGSKVSIFYGQAKASAPTADWIPWTVPKNASMLMIVAMSGGYGGGGGLTGASASARGGGGGGGSGGMARLLISTALLPKTLFVKAGTGGKGGAASTIGTSGGVSYVSDGAGVTSTGVVLVSANSGTGTPGAAGTIAGNNAAGFGETAAVGASVGIYTHLGLWTSSVGQDGAASGALGSVGQSVSFGGSGLPITGGAGGGSASVANAAGAGGTIIGAGRIPTLAGGVTAGGAGQSGYRLDGLSIGGSGGGATGASGVAGRGGNGSIGCGGGGGGGGVTGGAGGDGGVGMVMIVCW